MATTKKTTETKNELTAKVQQVLQVKTSTTATIALFSDDIDNHISDNGKAYRLAIEAITGDEQATDWVKAYSMFQLWVDYKAQNPKAKKADFQSFFKGSRTDFYDFLTSGSKVKTPKGNDFILDTPKDRDGNTFTVRNYALIANREHLAKEIADGIFDANMTQAKIKEQISMLKSVVSEDIIDEPETTETTETPEEAPEKANRETLEVYYNGEEVELTPEQVEAIIKIIGG